MKTEQEKNSKLEAKIIETERQLQIWFERMQHWRSQANRLESRVWYISAANRAKGDRYEHPTGEYTEMVAKLQGLLATTSNYLKMFLEGGDSIDIASIKEILALIDNVLAI